MAEHKQGTRVPEFENREEEATFWDSHDISDFADEVKSTRVRFAKHLSEGITVRFTHEALADLRACADDRGLGPTTLVRMWVLERLREEGGCAAATRRSS